MVGCEPTRDISTYMSSNFSRASLASWILFSVLTSSQIISWSPTSELTTLVRTVLLREEPLQLFPLLGTHVMIGQYTSASASFYANKLTGCETEEASWFVGAIQAL